MVTSVKDRTLGPVDLSFVADRVVNCLSRQEQSKAREVEDVYRKAATFLDVAVRGGEILKTGRLNVNASDSLRNYGWTARAYALLAGKRRSTRTEDLVSNLRELSSVLMSGAKGETIDKAHADVIKELFRYVRDIALSVEAHPTDRTTIISFSPKNSK